MNVVGEARRGRVFLFEREKERVERGGNGIDSSREEASKKLLKKRADCVLKKSLFNFLICTLCLIICCFITNIVVKILFHLCNISKT